MKKIYKNYKPLFFFNNRIYLVRQNKIFYLKNEELNFFHKLPNSIFRIFFDKFKLISRLLRSQVWSVNVFKNQANICYQGNLYNLDLNSKKISKELSFKKGRGPINFCNVENIKGFDDGIYFGEYFMNPNFNEINVYRKINNKKWNIIYTFKNNHKINHIHSLIADKYNNCIWILAGDFGEAATIFRAKDNFQKVEKILDSHQSHRGVVAFPTEKGLLYATDSQFIHNSIRLLSKENGNWQSKKLHGINGPVINGCKIRDYYVFSTSTEPGEEKSGYIKNFFDRNPGPGIKINESQVICLSKDLLNLKIIYKNEKDYFPYRLFQFGSISFPEGKNNSNDLYVFPTACCSDDQDTELLKI